jgi:hypothetical protein
VCPPANEPYARRLGCSGRRDRRLHRDVGDLHDLARERDSSVSTAKIKSNEGGSGTAIVSLGYVLLGIAALLVLFGIYLIVPQFH